MVDREPLQSLLPQAQGFKNKRLQEFRVFRKGKTKVFSGLAKIN